MAPVCPTVVLVTSCRMISIFAITPTEGRMDGGTVGIWKGIAGRKRRNCSLMEVIEIIPMATMATMATMAMLILMAVAVAVAETGTNNRLAGDASLVESRLVTVLTEMVPLRSFVYDVALAGAVTAVVEVVSGRVSSVRLHVACSDPDRDRDRDRGEDLEGTLSRFFSGKGFFFSSPATSLFFFVSRSFLSALSVPFFCVSEDCSRRCDCSSFSFNLLDSMDNSSREA
mmetsp:Transcript_24838/g.51225  ORF Transcript_24838/g.51225 Transcript_24838/m.51225 type:complete len:228 (-) Transcript_24838:209-892(-)